MQKLIASYASLLCTFVALTLLSSPLHAQRKSGGFLGGLSQGLNDVKNATKGVSQTAKEVTKTRKEVTNTVKTISKSWTKDESENIKYKQVPDYRNREEVEISKKQKLVIQGGEFKNVQWSPVANFDNQVFPSFIIGWASYKGTKEEDMGSSLGFSIRNNLPTSVSLKWEIECSDKNFFSIDSGFIAVSAGQKLEFRPKIAWNYRSLTKHETSAPMNIYFRLVDPLTNKNVQKVTTVTLRSINDCITSYGNKDYSYLFGAYVNEDHPEIDRILSDALKTKMVNEFLGYQAGPGYVDLQVAAIWRVLHERGFKYSSITGNSGDNSGNVYAQSVRTFENAIKTNQANCVDGTALFASILKRIKIRPVLVLVKGHCFLGYYTGDEPDARIAYLETVMLSENSIVTNPKKALAVPQNKEILREVLPKNVKLSDVNKCFFLEFIYARLEGEAKYEKNKKAATIRNEVDIAELRKEIMPIPYYQ